MQTVMNRKWKLLRNEKGLTLIELLAVIVVLGIIAAIAVPSIGGVIEKSKLNSDIQSETLLKETAVRYLYDFDPEGKGTAPGYDDTAGTVTLTDMVTEGYLKEVPKKQGGPDRGKTYASVAVTYNNTKGWTASGVNVSP